MDVFKYKGECGTYMLGVHIIMYLIGEVVWGTVQWVWDNSHTYNVIKNSCTTEGLNIKVL